MRNCKCFRIRGLVAAMLIAVVAASLSGCKVEKKTFSSSGMTIELNSVFKEKEVKEAQFYVESPYIMFMGNGEPKADIAVKTLSEYIELVLDTAKKDVPIHEDLENGFYYAFYESNASGVDFSYMMVCKEGEEKFYTMNFATKTPDFNQYKEDIMNWAKTITVA